MTPILNHQVAYYTFLYSGACHAMFWTPNAIRPSDLLRYKTQALQAMRVAIQAEGSHVSDETLFCMLMLATHGAADGSQRRPLSKVQSRKYLTSTLDAEFWGAREMEWQHLNVFYDLMKGRDNKFNVAGSVWNATALLVVLSKWQVLTDCRTGLMSTIPGCTFGAHSYLHYYRRACVLICALGSLMQRPWR